MTDEGASYDLDRVIIKGELDRRPSRPPDYEAENRALALLAGELAERPADVLQSLTDTIVAMGIADSAGISIRLSDGSEQMFRWDALSGEWSKFKGGTMPFDASPCGVVVRDNRTLLFEHPERVFPAAYVEPLIHEILLVPFRVEGRPIGTLWINAHSEARRFDREDARLLENLSRFASAGYRAVQALNRERDAKAELERRVEERTEALRASEERYRTLFETVDEGFAIAEMVYDAEGRAVDALYLEGNSAASRLTGGRRYDHVLLSENVPGAEPYWLEIYDRVARTGNAERHEEHLKPLGRWYDFHVSAIHRDGEPPRVAIIFQDVTDQKRAEAALRESEAKYRLLFEAMDESFAIVEMIDDEDGKPIDYRIIETNPAFAVHNGISNAAGRTARELVPDIEPAWIETYDRIARTREPERVTGATVGLGRVFDVFVFPVGAPAQRRVAVIGSDVTEREATRQALSESEGRMQLAMRVTGLVTWEWLPAEDRITTSDSFAALYGLPALAEARDGFALLLPEDAGAHIEKVRQVAAEGGSYTSEFRIRRPVDGRVVWLEERGEAERGADGQVQRVIGITLDITVRKRAEEALRASEERLRQFGDASQDVLWIRDAETLQWTYLTPAFETIYGLSRAEALAGNNYRSWQDLIVPEDRKQATDNIRRVRAGEQVTFEYRVRRPKDGEIRWLRNTDFPMTDASGKVTMVGGIGTDITAMKHAQEQIERSEERLRNAVEVGRLGLWDWNVVTGEIHWSDEHFRMEGYGIGEVTPSYEAWSQRLHPDDRAATEAALRQAMDVGEEYVHEFRVVHPDGSVHWLHGRGRFFYEDERPVRMVGAMIDITEQREWEERQSVLVAELQHRTRNLMGVVRSMSDKTARASADLPDFRARFRDRLEALSRVQGLLSRMNEHDRVTFDELIDTELAAMDGSADRITLSGPNGVRLRSSTVQTLALALHELATNAMKYGALSQSAGWLAISWLLEPEGDGGKPWLHIEWRESGVQMPAAGPAPRGTGQGRELIERALPYQLQARTTYVLGPDGVHCTISLPVSASTDGLEDHA